jgi:hypothetical protein
MESDFQCAVSLPPIRLLSRHFVEVLYQVFGARTAIVFVTKGSQIVFIDTSLNCISIAERRSFFFFLTCLSSSSSRGSNSSAGVLVPVCRAVVRW